MGLRQRRKSHLVLPDPYPLKDLANLVCDVARLTPRLVGVLIWTIVVSSKAVSAYRRDPPSDEEIDEMLDVYPEARRLLEISRQGRERLERRDPKRDVRPPLGLPGPRDYPEPWPSGSRD